MNDVPIPMATTAVSRGSRAVRNERRKAKNNTTSASKAPTRKSLEPPPWFSPCCTAAPPSWTLRRSGLTAWAVLISCFAWSLEMFCAWASSCTVASPIVPFVEMSPEL